MSNASTYYEVSFRAPVGGVIRHRFPFEDGKYGEARAKAHARIAELQAEAAAEVALAIVRRAPLPLSSEPDYPNH